MKRFFLTVAILFVALISTTSLSARELHVVPEPAYVDLEAEGEYVVTEKTRIIVVDDLWAPAARFTEDMMMLSERLWLFFRFMLKTLNYLSRKSYIVWD